MTDLDGTGCWDAVGEISGIEITLQASDGDDKLRVLDVLLDLRMCERSDINLSAYSQSSQTQLYHNKHLHLHIFHNLRLRHLYPLG
jgi:hypothetical protein